MSNCIKCGSYAFNLYKEGIDQGGLCDVHYWQGRAHRAEALAEQPAPPPPECQTEAEKTAFAFGWFKALESVRQQPVAWANPNDGIKEKNSD